MTQVILAETHSTEDEATMKAFQQVFDFVNKARNAVIDASNLAKEVSAMRAELDSLKVEMEEAHRKNADFESQLSYVRQERDVALQQAQDWERRYVAAQSSLEVTQREHDDLKSKHLDVAIERDNVAVERDAAHMESRRLQEELETERRAHTKLRQEIETMYAKLQPQPRNEVGQFQSPYVEEPRKVATSW